MGANVICISRTVGAGGEVVGEAVAHRLGFRYVDEEVAVLAAEKARLELAAITAAEHRQPLVRRLFEAIGLPQRMPDLLSYARPSEPHHIYQLSSPVGPGEDHDPRAFIREAIHDLAAEGSTVIVAHAASLALAGERGVLRVLVTASAATRAQRLSGLLLGRDAETAIRQSDDERAEYLRRFHQVAHELPTHYDLVVNTDHLTPERAVAIVVAAART